MNFYGTVKEGKLEIETPQKWKEFLRGLEGKKLQLEVEKFKRKRSNQQNRFYWLYMQIIADETGHDEMELHEFFKRKFLPPVYKTILGESIKLPNSTTELGKHDFGEYLEKICALTNVPIPNPEDAGFIRNY